MKLSIITINLNNQDGLRKTIESAISQTFTDFEYIVIDGASTDGSVDIIEAYADRITYWISEPDKGIYNAMNKGILQAKGEYCLFLNSGDWLIKNNVLEIVFRQDNNTDLIIGRLHQKHNNIRGIIKKEPGESLRFSDFYIASLLHPCTFIKRNLFERVGLYDENYRIVSDWLFFLLSVVNNHSSYSFLNTQVSDIQTNGISSIDVDRMLEERTRVLYKYFPCFIEDYKDYFLYKNSRTLSRMKELISWITKLRKKYK
ncbi:glycosyl transferase [Bacteroidia bacterium]|nr:glycosyl transferase [Bacteroidia bacterium]GHT48116.1 glycosyl transferase [Bacteroidia bacterium]